MAEVYADTSNIVAGAYIFAADVKIPIDQLDSVVANILMGTTPHNKLEIQNELLFSSTVNAVVSGGAITVSKFLHTLSTGGLGQQTLRTINGVPGKTQMIVIRPLSNTEPILIEHGLAGNIRLSIGEDYLLQTVDHVMILFGDGTSWYGVGFGNDHKHQGSDIENLTAAHIVGGIPAAYISGLDTGDISGLQVFVDGRVVALTSGGVSLVPAIERSIPDDGLAASGYVFANEDTNSTAITIDGATGAPSVVVSRKRGFIMSGGSGSAYQLRVHGEVDFASRGAGFTPNLPLYYNTKAGQQIGTTRLSHTPPEPVLNGGQIAVVEVGYAKTATLAFLTDRHQVVYTRRDLMNNGDIVVVKHHDDKLMTRELTAYVRQSLEKVGQQTPRDQGQFAITTKISAVGVDENYDYLSATLLGMKPVGNDGGVTKAAAQVFRPLDDVFLKSVTFAFGANVGSPSGQMRWEYRSATSTGPTASLYQSGLFTPIPNSTITIIPNDFRAKPLYHVVNTYFSMSLIANQPQPDNSYWQVKTVDGAANYTRSSAFTSVNGGSTWTADAASDLMFAVEMRGVIHRQKMAVPIIQDTTGPVEKIALFGSVTGAPLTTATLFATLYTNNAGVPDTLVTGGSSVVLDVLNLPTTTNYDDFYFEFPQLPVLTAGVTYWLVIESSGLINATKSPLWIAKYSTTGAAANAKYWDGATWIDDSLIICHRVLGPVVETKRPVSLIGWNSANLEGMEGRYGDKFSNDVDGATTVRLKRTVESDVTTIIKV
jgi:hypothetical protein